MATLTPVIAAHVAGGISLIVLGLLALTARKSARSRHPVVGQAYFWVLLLTLSLGFADGLMRHPGRLTLFQVVTPPTLLLGVLGYLMATFRPRRFLGRPWLAWHIAGQGGSFIGVVTATTFQLLPRVLPDALPLTVAYWILPTAVGSVLIARATARWTARRPAMGAAAETARTR
jgi:hypothetical protein